MVNNEKILEVVKYTGALILSAGILIFLFGMFSDDAGAITGIGIGTIMGAIFIFIMGIFLAGTEEMIMKGRRGKGGV